MPIRPGDVIQIIAPASKTPEPAQDVEKVTAFIKKWKLIPRILPTLFADTPYHNMANTDEQRFADLKNAILDPEVKGIWCIRGGYGTIRLFPYLKKYFTTPPPQKLFIGFSDITLLHIYFNQVWGWNSIHGPVAIQAVNNQLDSADIEILRQIMFGEVNDVTINNLTPFNKAAQQKILLTSSLAGGNLTVISRLFGTPYELQTKDKILFLEDVDEPFRKVDGMLQQFILAGLLEEYKKPAAVILGQFSNIYENQLKEISCCLAEFASKLDTENIPVLRCMDIGHSDKNHPLPIGTKAKLEIDQSPKLIISLS